MRYRPDEGGEGSEGRRPVHRIEPGRRSSAKRRGAHAEPCAGSPGLDAASSPAAGCWRDGIKRPGGTQDSPTKRDNVSRVHPGLVPSDSTSSCMQPGTPSEPGCVCPGALSLPPIGGRGTCTPRMDRSEPIPRGSSGGRCRRRPGASIVLGGRP